MLQAFLIHPASPEAADDQNITEDALALFGSVVAEVDRWYKRREIPVVALCVFPGGDNAFSGLTFSTLAFLFRWSVRATCFVPSCHCFNCRGCQHSTVDAISEQAVAFREQESWGMNIMNLTVCSLLRSRTSAASNTMTKLLVLTVRSSLCPSANRVRATLDPVRANAEARVKSFEARKERARDHKVKKARERPISETSRKWHTDFLSLYTKFLKAQLPRTSWMLAVTTTARVCCF